MIVNLDVDGLKRKRDALQQELVRVDTMLELITQFSLPAPNGSAAAMAAPAAAPAAADEVAAPQPKTRTRIRRPVSGKRKAVTVALQSGPVSEVRLAQLLNWDTREVSRTVSSMLMLGLVVLGPQGLQLTPKGKQQAQWFQRHPQYTVYCPDKEARRHMAH